MTETAVFAVNLALLAMLLVTAVGILKLYNLFAVVMVSGMYSLLCAAFFVLMDAVDVAFTEAAVGAGLSTVLMLAALALTRPNRKDGDHKALNIPAKIVTFVVGLLLFWISMDFPGFGDPLAPVNQHLAPQFLTEGPEKTTVPNVVTVVLASYRGYDTLGETVVVFTAAVSVLCLLGVLRGNAPVRSKTTEADEEEFQEFNSQIILRVITKYLTPFILLFALYVQFHGDYGPGGGFQAGVIFAAGLILYGMVYGIDRLRDVVGQKHRVPLRLAGLGVLLYAGVGVASLMLGGNFLDYNVLAEDPRQGQHLGILLVEFGVGLTVTNVMILVFLTLAGRGYRDGVTSGPMSLSAELQDVEDLQNEKEAKPS